jgi:peptidyl-prolyl cis-trans isomerase D
MAMMISKFHKLVGSKRVWTVFAVLISVAFVVAYSGGKSGRKRAQGTVEQRLAGKLYGKEISRNAFSREYQNVYLRLVLNAGRRIDVNPQVDQYLREQTWQRLAILQKAEQMGLVATQEQLKAAISQNPFFQNRQTGAFDRSAYDMFFNQILPSIGLRLSPEEFNHFLAGNLLIDKVSAMAAQSALVTDAEVDHAFHIYSDKLTVLYTAIPRSLVAAPEITPEEAKVYYQGHPQQFACPDMVKVRYVEFPATDYADEIDVTDDMVAQVYEANKQRFVVDGTETAPEYQPLEEVKETIAAEIKNGLARRKATSAAGQMVSKLSSQSSSFDELAQAAGKTINSTPPFALTDSVRGIDPTIQTQFARTAFSLQDDPNHFYSDPVVGKDSVYVLVLSNKMPSFLPDFEVVAEEAVSAATLAAAEKAYLDQAEELHANLEKALKTGASFADLIAKAGLEISTTTFSVEEPPSEELEQTILPQTALFDAGTLVDLIPTEDEFLVAYIASKESADRVMADPIVIDQIRASVQNDKATLLVNAWRESILAEAGLEDMLDAANNNS